ncbi:hypothetical protein [Arthrobacter antibioticus]|uniref:hypothetical protein n=1 Tax=Arthrobacter sp. H35-MC1 TaxID=3046203 RepID=UPI0024BAA0B4|nr:hypothetical protein [Arthrobacter sp. H35-MC1]MDJ0316462.1 hypothetical protein [Arthrobacter sp. H35-MC1]
MTPTIQLAILLGRTDRAGTAIEELWRHAQTSVAGTDAQIRCIAVHAVQGDSSEMLSHAEVKVVALKVPMDGKVTGLVKSWAAKEGVLGIAGRLAQHNFASRRVARALMKDSLLMQTFCESNVIVSADPEADRAVWRLRGRTAAHLMHGPFAMAHALSEVAQE